MYSDPITEQLNDGDPLIAVVGANDDPRKYGHQIYRNLKNKGYRVVPVNLHRATVDGDTAYPDLASLPEPPDIVNIVVPPHQTLRVLEAAKTLGLTTVWLQPGAESAAVIDYLDEQGFAYLANACIMVRSRVKA
jgi:predicted CoA-binding protein